MCIFLSEPVMTLLFWCDKNNTHDEAYEHHAEPNDSLVDHTEWFASRVY